MRLLQSVVPLLRRLGRPAERLPVLDQAAYDAGRAACHDMLSRNCPLTGQAQIDWLRGWDDEFKGFLTQV